MRDTYGTQQNEMVGIEPSEYYHHIIDGMEKISQYFVGKKVYIHTQKVGTT